MNSGNYMVARLDDVESQIRLISVKDNPEMPVRVRNMLEKFGDEPILKIQMGRTPVQDFPIKLLNFLSNSRFSDKQLELGYDEIYHNYLLITIRDSDAPNVVQHMLGSLAQGITPGMTLKLEKTQRISLKYPPKHEELIDVYEIPLSEFRPLTLNRLLNAASNFDKDFYVYDAGENNMCQTFVERILQINGLLDNITDPATLEAIKPIDAKALIATLGSRSAIVKKATDFSATLDRVIFDHEIILKKPKPQEAFQLKSHKAIYEAVLNLEQNAQCILYSPTSPEDEEFIITRL